MRLRCHELLRFLPLALYLVLSPPLHSTSTHWAFQPIRNPSPPLIPNQQQSHTAIDRFLLHELQTHNLSFSPPADPITLLRRATFDLTGLPPTPAETAAFQADSSPDAFDKVIDRLLDSPSYGERWGRYWLDVARYADNKGYVFFEEKNFPWSYTYRDYVINAFNNDLPYDQFILQQLAADQLDLRDDQHPLAAMGFLTLGGRFMNSLHDVIDDRIDVTTRGLLGLTVTCARCHDHKYDPIPQADYYSLYGVFRSSAEPILPPTFRPPPDPAAFAVFEQEMTNRTAKLERFVDQVYGEIARSARQRMDEYLMAAYAERNVPPTENFMLITEKGELNPSVIHRWRAYLEKNHQHPVWIPWHQLADLPEKDFNPKPILQRLTSNSRTTPPINATVLNALTNAPLESMADVAKVYASLLRDADALETNPANEQLKAVAHDHTTPIHVPRQLGWGFLALIPDRATQGEFKNLIKEVETWSMTGSNAPARAMVLVDSTEPYNPQIFIRGNPNRLGDPVPKRFLKLLGQKPFRHGSGRLEMAQAIVNPDNPLTARVIVNRIWHHHFGQGLVTTPSDFGLRSDPPSHPELLDHLATTFINNGWSIKNLHRAIMRSAAYQQDSQHRPEAHARDPGNQLLWKFNRQRLTFEASRDTLLAVSGSLDPHLGGPPTEILGHNFSPRRTLYGFIDRMDLPGLYRAFDFPDPAATCPRRDQTTVAPQALYFMNHPFVAQCAEHLFNRPEIINSPNPHQRLTHIYQILFSRNPTPAELQTADRFFNDRNTNEAWTEYIHALLMTNELVFID